MHDLIALISGCFTDVHKPDQGTPVQLMKLGSTMQKRLALLSSQK